MTKSTIGPNWNDHPEWGFDTLQIHAGYTGDATTGAQTIPIYPSNAFHFPTVEAAANRFALKELGQIYSRLTNPTNDTLEGRIAALEGGTGALVTASGQAAITLALLTLASPGKNIVASPSIYGGTFNLLARTFEDLDAPVEGAPGVYELAPGAPPSSLPRLMERVSTWHRRRSLVILITDTAHPGPDAATWLRRLSIQHEMIVVQIEDDDPLRQGGGRGRDIDLPFEIPAFLRADSYLAAQAAVVREQWRTSVEQVLDARHLEYGVVSSEETLIDSIAELLQRERAAVARGRR